MGLFNYGQTMIKRLLFLSLLLVSGTALGDTFGSTVLPTGDPRTISNTFRGVKSTCPVAGAVLQSITAAVRQEYGTSYRSRGALYDATTNAFVATTPETVSTTSGDLWLTYTVTSTVVLQNKQYYILAWGQGGNGNTGTLKNDGGTSYYASQTYSASGIASSTATFSSMSETCGAYATYTTPSGSIGTFGIFSVICDD